MKFYKTYTKRNEILFYAHIAANKLLSTFRCVITMTTVGYGDVYPRTTVGKILAGMCSISGIILLAFPISVIVDNFNQVILLKLGQRKFEFFLIAIFHLDLSSGTRKAQRIHAWKRRSCNAGSTWKSWCAQSAPYRRKNLYWNGAGSAKETLHYNVFLMHFIC